MTPYCLCSNVDLDEDEVVEYDEEGNPIFPNRRYIDPLPPINHNEIEYDAFEKNFYNEHPDIAGLSIVQVSGKMYYFTGLKTSRT